MRLPLCILLRHLSFRPASLQAEIVSFCPEDEERIVNVTVKWMAASAAEVRVTFAPCHSSSEHDDLSFSRKMISISREA